MRILEWVEGWIRPRQPGPACYNCGTTELQDPGIALRQFADNLVACHDCLYQPMAYYSLKRKYWEEHPEKMPPCKHCGEVVPAGQLHLIGAMDWHFCTECAIDGDFALDWGNQRALERRIRASRVR